MYGENLKLKLCTRALGIGTKFQLEIIIRSTISAMHTFGANMLESSRNVSEPPPPPPPPPEQHYRTPAKTLSQSEREIIMTALLQLVL